MRPYSQIFAFFLDPQVYANRLAVKDELFGRNLADRMVYAARSLVGNLWNTLKLRGIDEPGLVGKRWLVAGSRNEEDAVAFLLEDDRYRLVPANVYRPRGAGTRVNWYPRPKWWYLPRYWTFLRVARRADPTHFRRVFQHLLHGVGTYENHLAVLRRYRPEVVVVSHDHLPSIRALALAARKLGIPTVYLQHASVREDFPPLVYDLSLLDGEDALAKYRAGGKEISGRVELVGSPKYDAFRDRINTSTTVRRFGLPYGFFDDPARVADLARAVSDRFPEWAVTVRPHPRDERPFPLDAAGPGVTLSLGKDESAFDFLARQDAMASSDSAIHLEATLLNVSSFFVPFVMLDPQPADGYGFVAAGLVPAVPTLEELLTTLDGIRDDRPEVSHRARPYDAGVGRAGWSSTARSRAAIDALLNPS